jgi:hypothetical protein
MIITKKGNGKELFYFDFVRQFMIYDEEEYSHMEQLHCEFVFKLTDERNILRSQNGWRVMRI